MWLIYLMLYCFLVFESLVLFGFLWSCFLIFKTANNPKYKTHTPLEVRQGNRIKNQAAA